MIAGGKGSGYLASTELYNLKTKTRLENGGDLTKARYIRLVAVGPASQLRILAFGSDLVEEWQEESKTWKEAGRLEKSRQSYVMGAVAVSEVCEKEN